MAESQDLAWLVESRSSIQRLLYRLHAYAEENPSELPDGRAAVFQLLVGTAFSLWRAVFLTELHRDRQRIQSDAAKFLLLLVRDNAINYPQDRETRAWTAGYYLNNAYFRLRELCTDYAGPAGLAVPESCVAVGKFFDLSFEDRVEADLARLWDQAYEAARDMCDALMGSGA